MFDLRRIPVLRVLLPFFGGIVSDTLLISYLQHVGLVLILLFLWVLALFVFLWQRSRSGSGYGLFTLLLFLVFFGLGVVADSMNRPLDPGLPVNCRVLIRGELTETPNLRSGSYVFEMKTFMLSDSDSIYRATTHLKVHMFMPDDSVMPGAGEIWQLSGQLVPVKNSGNPGAPDYRSIMGRKDCWYHFYPSVDPLESNRELAEKGRRISPAFIRQIVSSHWQGESEDIALLKAVCLGDRSTLSDELREAYSSAGGMHLLAVSGLHVGLIWWVLQYMTGWISMIFKDEKQRTIMVLALLWFYAFVTGFSSSVCRSVTMFTFFSLGRMMGQRTHSLNGILVSAFVLVLIDPQRLMDVGFQLSYTAIIGIIGLYPLFRKILRTKKRVLRWLWEALSVSLAAQIATAPLVIFYFHQLPVYSLLTSLVAIPLLSVLIAIFVISVPFVSAGILESVFNFLQVKLARLMNAFMEYISSLPGAVLDDLQLGAVSLFFCMLLLLLLMISLHGRKRISWYLFLLCISGFLTGNILESLNRIGSSELIISHFRGSSMVIVRDGKRMDQYCWYGDSTSMQYMENYRDATWSRRIYHKQLHEMGEQQCVYGIVSTAMRIRNDMWLLGGDAFGILVLRGGVLACRQEATIADSIFCKPGTPCFILLSGEPSLKCLPASQGKHHAEFILDGSNRRWYMERVLMELDSIYITERSGAFVKRW